MKQKQVEQSGEPVGIIISRGRDLEKAPRFIAYMWAPAPEIQSDDAIAA